MSHSQIPHPLEGLVADYLNGHLSEADVQKIDAAITENADFRKMVEFERSIQQSISAEQTAPNRVPQFSKIADQLDDSAPVGGLLGGSGSALSLRWTTWVPTAAVAILVAVVVGYLPYGGQTINEFETLSDIPVTYDEPVLRMINKTDLDESALNQLIREYDLKIIKRYPDANAMDVISNQPTQLDVLAKLLENDQRVKFVQIKQAQ